MVVRTKPAAKASPRSARAAAPAKKAAAPARKAATPTRKPAAASSGLSEAKQAALQKAQAARREKAAGARSAATEGADVHPTRKEEVTAHDVLRARHTYEVLYSQWLQQQGEDITDVLNFVAPILTAPSGQPKRSPIARTKVAPEERDIEQYFDRDKFEALPIKEIREIAADLVANKTPGMTETKVKSVILEQMEAAGLFREEGPSDVDEDDIEDDDDEDVEEDDELDDEESDSDDDDDEDVETFTRADLKKKTLDELQDLAEINEVPWKGLGKSDLIDALLGGPEDDEDEEEEESDEEDDGEAIEIDPDELPNMDIAELLDLCEQIGIADEIPANKKKSKSFIVNAILEQVE